MRRFWFKMAVAGIAAIVPAITMAGDQELAQQIGQNLKSSGKLKGYSIAVTVDDGVAKLNGTVATAQQLDDALSIAEVTPGIERVLNNLTVKAPSTAAAKPALRQPGNLFNGSTGVQQTAAATPTAPVLMAQPAMPQTMPAPSYARPMPMGTPRPTQMASRQVPTGPSPAPGYAMQGPGAPMPSHIPSPNGTPAPMAYDSPNVPNYAWPSYAASPNYAAVTYPKQYSASAWPYIGPFYPYPQVPMGWRKVSLEWDDGWWQLDFKD
ncbi:MAG: BON domain-containing protein [Pirellulales bacterium]